MATEEQFRVFRHDGGGLVYVGTFEAANSKEAARKGVYASRTTGDGVFEVHVLRNAGVFEARTRIEHFIDSLGPLNTQQFFSDNPPS